MCLWFAFTYMNRLHSHVLSKDLILWPRYETESPVEFILYKILHTYSQ